MACFSCFLLKTSYNYDNKSIKREFDEWIK